MALVGIDPLAVLNASCVLHEHRVHRRGGLGNQRKAGGKYDLQTIPTFEFCLTVLHEVLYVRFRTAISATSRKISARTLACQSRFGGRLALEVQTARARSQNSVFRYRTAYRMRVDMRTLLRCALLVGVGCGKGPQISISTPAAEHQTLAQLCSAEPHENLDGSYTQTGCSFIQQQENMRHNGVALAGAARSDASGIALGSFEYSCDRWLMGADVNGTSIIVDAQSGEVISHGLVHPGEPTSSLVSPVALPLR